MVEDDAHTVRQRAEAGGAHRDSALSEAAGDSEPGRRDDVAPSAATTRYLAVRGLAAVGVAIWCVTVLAIGVNLAESAWEWAWIFGFGTVVPALLLWQVGRLLAPEESKRPSTSAKDKEKELLRALSERGELTPITAAVRTSLTADEAARMLEGLAGKGYLRLRVEDGIQTYALREQDLGELPGGDPPTARPAPKDGPPAPQPLDEPLSERELEVLALLASGKTNREIAADLFVTVGTVKSHTSNIYGKLGVRNRAEALARARDLGLIP
jgi:DNA-binding CsgD family transcriptional regulator